ncbi:MAG: glycerophosphodiester phosphodiesterase family protein [bacterium]|nr:glycerophosphodiester phosphodiesterase family protein [bacterium]
MKRTENIEGELKKIDTLTHRGLDPEKENYFVESSREAFADQIARGFGLEFDLQFTKDKKLVVLHDSSLTRPTGGVDTRKISEITLLELLKMDIRGSHLASFKELLQMMTDNPSNPSINAIHIKSKLQETEYLNKIAEEFRGADAERFIFFDLKPEAARELKEKNPALHLAASLSHPYDIERYNSAVGGTLLPIEEVIKNRDIYDWVWLDEWDRTDKDGGTKSLYNKETFERLRSTGFKIALVTPELHATSPGLLGGEAHQDAATKAVLERRFKEIVALHPDAICTDHPDKVKSLS